MTRDRSVFAPFPPGLNVRRTHPKVTLHVSENGAGQADEVSDRSNTYH
jgi:hypothetical protein